MKINIVIIFLLFSFSSFAAKITVMNNNDSGSGSIREAIVNFSADGDTIIFTNSLSSSMIEILSPIKINKNLVIDATGLSSQVVFWGNIDSSLFYVTENFKATFKGVRFTFTKNGAIDAYTSLCLYKCYFDNNYGNSGLIRCGDSIEVISCRFEHNYSNSGSSCIRLIGNGRIVNSVFANNAQIHSGTIVTIFGGIILQHCTFFNNRVTGPQVFTGVTGGGALNINFISEAFIENCIFWGNSDPFYYHWDDSIVHSDDIMCDNGGGVTLLENSIIQHDSCRYSYNCGPGILYNVNPMFYNLPFDYTVASISPAVDAGKIIPGVTDDYYGNPRDAFPDMGAFEYIPISGYNKPVSSENKITIYPNPAKENIYITSEERIEKIFIYNSIGEKIKTADANAEINISELVDGIYTVVIINDKEIFSKSFVKVN